MGPIRLPRALRVGLEVVVLRMTTFFGLERKVFLVKEMPVVRGCL
jgi:hypothetical protein